MEKSEKRLTPKQQAFVEIFVKENGRLTATECAKQAGYSEKSAISQASVMRNPKYFPHVVKAIEDLLYFIYIKTCKILSLSQAEWQNIYHRFVNINSTSLCMVFVF